MVLRLRQHNIGYTADGFYRPGEVGLFYNAPEPKRGNIVEKKQYRNFCANDTKIYTVDQYMFCG